MAAGMPRLLAFALAALLTYGASADVDIVDLKSKSQKTLLSQARRRLTEWSPCPGLFAGTPKSTFERVPSHEEYLAALEKLDSRRSRRTCRSWWTALTLAGLLTTEAMADYSCACHGMPPAPSAKRTM
jgi:hypothetical protein